MRVIQGRDPFYQVDQFQLFLGDSLELLKLIAPNSVDMIFADPPYGLSNGGFTCQAGRRVSVNKGAWDQSQGAEADFAFHREWIQACRRVLKPHGTIWISGSYHSIFACGYALQLAGYKVLNDIAWFKPNGAPNLSCRYFTASHETLVWARKRHDIPHTFNYEAMKYGEWHNNDALKKPKKQMRSVWSLSTARGEETRQGKHPTQKPIALLERIVLACTEPGALILDPFTGSSTTGIAALQHNRHFIGIDIDATFLDLSRQRAEACLATIDRSSTEDEMSLAVEEGTTTQPSRRRRKSRHRNTNTNIASPAVSAEELCSQVKTA